MSDATQPLYTEATRRLAQEFLAGRRTELAEQWQTELQRLFEDLGPSRGRLLQDLMNFLPVMIEALPNPDHQEAVQQQLAWLAEDAHHDDVPYLRLSRALRVLKRTLMRLTVDNLPGGAARDQVCDFLEEEIDTCRLWLNQYFHTLHDQLLRDSEALTRFLLNNTYDAIFLVEVETGRIEMANAMATEVSGRSQDELRQLTFVELVPPHRASEVLGTLRGVVRQHSGQFAEMPLVRPDGQTVPTMMQLTLVPRDGRNQLVQVSVRDMTQETAALAAQEKEAAFLRAFVTGTADAVMLIGLDGRIRSWNKGAEQIFGYRAEEIMGQAVDILLPPDVMQSGELAYLDSQVTEEGFIRNVESVRVTHDGRRIDVNITRTAISDPATGQRIGTSAVVRDVSDRKRLERDMARKTRQLEIMNRILEATSRSLDRDQTFRTIAAQMEGLLPCDAMIVCLPEAEAERLRCRVLVGGGGLVVGSETMVDRQDTLQRDVLATHESRRIDELAALSDGGPYDRELGAMGFRSALVAPMVYNNEAVGTILLLHREPAQYDEDDRAQLDHLANHFAVILENARRYEEERKRSAQFELISRVGAAAIANIGDVKRLMRSVVDTIQTDFGYYDVAIYEVDEDAEVFRLRAQAGHRRGALGEGYEQPLGVGVFGEVLRSQASYVCNNTQNDPLYFDPAPEGSNVRSELCVPIRLGPRVFGVLDVESQRLNRFDRLDRAAMEALASLLARCMEADESLRHTRMLQAMRHNIMEAVPSALILLDDDLKVKFVNRRYCEFFNQSVEEIMNRHATEVFPPMLLDESRFIDLVQQLKESRRPIDQREVRYFDFNGQERYADVRLRIVTEYETNIIVMLHDATMRLKRLYQLSMLQEIGEEMQRTLDTDRLLQAILTCVTAGPGFGFNRAALFLYERESRQLLERMRVGPATPEEAGEVWHQLGHKKSLREFLREYDRSRDGDGVALRLDHDPLRIDIDEDDGDLRRWRTPLMLRADDQDENLPVARALRDYSGAFEVLVVPLVSQETVLGLIVADNLFTGEPISRDSIRMLTTFANQAGVALANAQAFEALEQSLAKLRRTQDQLRRAERLAGIGSVAAHVAHEIRNPLVSIGGFARRLSDKVDDPSYVVSRASIIVKEVQRLEQILKNVADFTAPGAPVFKDTQVAQVVQDVLTLQQPVFEEHRIRVHPELDWGLPAIPADPDKLKQVVLNLVRNAVQAMGADGEVWVGTQWAADGNAVEIRVRDNGPGIPPARLEEIFNPFFTNKADGTGLGLAVSRKIVADHGGDITVQSREGEGATFTVRLPLQRPVTPATVESEEKVNATPRPDR